MNKTTSLITACALSLALAMPKAYAGNPDRQGEAGAYELLINPWARSIGLNGLITARTTGVEALYFNPAGLGRLRGTELMVSHTQYLVGTNLSLNTAGFGQSIGKSSTFGVSLMSVGFGDIPLTTTNQPEGIGTFSPSFFNIGLSYGHMFRDKNGIEKISVGFTVRVISESIANARASGIGFDAGMQYATGENNQLKFGIALRNIGTKMRFSGEGLSYVGIAPNGTTAITTQTRTAGFDLPSLLQLGLSYDFLLAKDDSTGVAQQRLTTLFNFTANSYSRDQIGIGFEYAYQEMFMARVAYKYEGNMYNANTGNITSGLTAGVGVEVPFKKGSARRIAFDYGFEYTRIFKGTHSVGIKLNI
jgi:hypothetical protein